MILIQKILFNKKECDSLIWDNCENIANFDMFDRKYDAQPIEFSLKTEWLFNKLKTFFEESTGIKIIRNKETIHFHKFIKNNWFSKHNDIRENRVYGVGVLLNDDFEGGKFKLYNPDEIILDKAVGNTYLFDVRIEHEVTKILEGTRYSLLWFLELEHLKFKTDKLI